jgi:hypothetical protein
MTPTEYLHEIERRFYDGDQRGAYEIWLAHRDDRLDLPLAADGQRRLRAILHILMQMAAGLGWDTEQATGAPVGRRAI